MADEEKTMVHPEGTDGPPPRKGSIAIKKYGLYAAIVVVSVLVAYFVTLKVVKPMISGGKATAQQEADKRSEANKEDDKKSQAKKDSDRNSHASSDPVAGSDIYMIEQIIVNPAGTEGRRYLSTSIGLELESPGVKAALKEKEAIVRDALIMILSSQTVPELSDFKQRERLRKLIRLKICKLLETEDVSGVYFTEFVLQ